MYGLVLGSKVYLGFKVLCLLKEMQDGKTYLCWDFGSIHSRHAAAKKRIFSALPAHGTLSPLNASQESLSCPTQQGFR